MTSGESLLLVAISHQYSLHYYIDNYYKKKTKKFKWLQNTAKSCNRQWIWRTSVATFGDL